MADIAPGVSGTPQVSSYPTGVCASFGYVISVDSNGVLYLACRTTILAMLPSGSAYNIIGQQSGGHVDGVGSSVRFGYLESRMTIDLSGNMYECIFDMVDLLV